MRAYAVETSTVSFGKRIYIPTAPVYAETVEGARAALQSRPIMTGYTVERLTLDRAPTPARVELDGVPT